MYSRQGLAFALFSLIMLTSCGEKAPESTSEQSTFEVLAVEATKTSLSSEGSDVNWKSLSNSLIINLSACIRDNAVAASVVGEGFEISTPTGTKREVSDSNGCLNWSESFSFSPTMSESYYQFPVTITGIGHYKGVRTIELAIGPTVESADKVFDLRYQKLGYPLYSFEELSDVKELKARPLNNMNIDFAAVSLSLADYQAGADTSIYKYQFEAKIDLLKENLDQVGQRKTLETGLFKARLELVEVQAQAQRRLLSSAEAELRLVKGVISKEVIFTLPRNIRPSESSTLEVYLTLDPINGPTSISSLSGKLTMNFLKGSQSGTWDRIAQIDSAEWSVASEEIKEDRSDLIEDAGEVQSELSMENMTFTYGAHDSADYNTNARKTLHSKIGFCLVDPHNPAGSSTLTQERFNVEILTSDKTIASKKENLRLDQSGCAEINLPITYSRFGCEKYLDYEVVATANEGNIAGLGAKAKIALNPWNSSDFGHHLDRTTPAPLVCENPARIHLGAVDYKYEGLDYDSFKINKFLHLSLHKLYQFNFRPMVERFSSTTEEKTQSLTFGNLKIKALIFSPLKDGLDYFNPNLEDFKFLSATEKTIKISASSEATDILSFPFYASETHLLGLKNLLLIKASWSAEGQEGEGDIQSVVMAMPFYPSKPQMTGHPVAIEEMPSKTFKRNDINTIIAESTKYLPYDSDKFKDEVANTTIELFRNNLVKRYQSESVTFTFGDLGDLNSLLGSDRLSFEQMRLLSSTAGIKPPRVLKHLCKLLAPQSLGQCQERPENFVDTKAITHINELLSTQKQADKTYGVARFVSKDLGNIYRGEGYFATWGDRYWSGTGDTVSTTRKIGAESMIGPPPFLVSLSGGISKAWESFSTTQEGKMQAAFDRNFTQRTKVNLDYNKLELEFLANVTNCFVASSLTGERRMLHICEERPRLKKMSEEWYFIGPSVEKNHGILADNQTLKDQELSQIIRGRANYNRLWGNFRKEDVSLVMTQIKDQVVSDSFIEARGSGTEENPFEHYSDNAFPGAFTPFEY